MLELRAVSVGYRGKPLLCEQSFSIAPGEILGLNGVSGCGKSTLGRALAGLHPLLSGDILINGRPLSQLPRPLPVFYLAQEPRSVMNPRLRIRQILAEAGSVDPEMAARLGVHPSWSGRFAHELSGGQLQRVALLRALTVGPKILIADEITESLDPLSQAEIWQILRSLTAEGRIGILAISHQLALLRSLASRIITL